MITGGDALSKAVRDLMAAGGSLRPAMQEIGADFTAEIQLGFRAGHDPWGTKWAPLAESTQAKNNGRRRGGQPLRDTGLLGNSITPSNATDISVEIGTMDIRAGTHQFGAAQGAYGRTSRNGPIPWGAVPARQFLPIRAGRVDLPAEWSAMAERSIVDHITRGMP